MKTYFCDCGNRVYLYNSQCVACGVKVGFDPDLMRIIPIYESHADLWLSLDGREYRLCRNWLDHDVCNWLLPDSHSPGFCLACSLNRTIPNLADGSKIALWGHLEMGKRHLIYNLLRLGLPVISKQSDPVRGLAFDFLEDQRHNPNILDEIVTTGHRSGLITINLAEADDLHREQTRLMLGEAYRTLLGHLRHESGHYYFDLLVKETPYIDQFRACFGSEQQDYQRSMNYHYQSIDGTQSRHDSWRTNYISSYAQAHPLEDWAECWAHYMLVADACETAVEFGIVPADIFEQEFTEWQSHWLKVSSMMNALSRSLGLKDSYPFVLTPQVVRKIQFVHHVIHRVP